MAQQLKVFQEKVLTLKLLMAHGNFRPRKSFTWEKVQV